MKGTCSYCGLALHAETRGRYYPGDETILCEHCYPFREPATARQEETTIDEAKRLLNAPERPIR